MNKREQEILQSQLNTEKQTIKRLKQVYAQAVKDCEKKIRELSMRTDLENIQSIVYQKQYQQAIKGQLEGILEQLHSNEYATISEYLTKCYHEGYVGTMYDLAGQGIPLIMPIDQEQVTQAIQIDSKLSKTLYESLGEDVNKLKTAVKAQVSRGIAAGLTWNQVAENLANRNMQNTPYGTAINNAIRIARTEGHRIQVASAMDAQEVAKSKGADILKQWNAALDGRTRPHHRMLDGQIRETNEDFEVSGMKVKAPGYFGKPSEDCNCRCALSTRARWALDEAELEKLKKRAEYYELDKTEDFEDYQKKFLKASEEERVRLDVQKSSEGTSQEKAEKKSEVTIESINAKATESLLDAYDARRIHFNLNETTADELRSMGAMNPMNVNYKGVSLETAKVFDETIRNLSDEYLTGFTKIEVGSKKEFIGVNIFATTNHNNLVGQKTLILNPHKTGDYDKLTERIKELSEKGYAVKIREGLEGQYIATHEFAHSLVDLSGDYKNYIGMDVKLMKGIKKEVDTLYNTYKDEVTALETAFKKKELAFLEATFSSGVDEDTLNKLQKAALESKRALDAVKISKYSMENADEFMAEAFTQHRIGITTNKYSEELVGILDKHFKKETLEKLEKSSNIISGAVSGARNPYGEKAKEHAQKYYGLVRSMKTDVAKISKATGMDEKDIQDIKNFVFLEKHDLGGKELEYFEPDYMMAETWQRLIEGKPEAHDITMLKHEVLEKELMQNGMSQEEAHIEASKKYNYSKEAGEYYAKIEKYKKE